MTKYAYTSSVRPIITYGAFAFAGSLTKGQTSKLKAFQRQILTHLGNFRKGTPGDALDVITDTMPIDLFLKAEMLKGNYRVKPHFDDNWTGMGSKTKIGHVLKAKVNERMHGFEDAERDEINQPLWDCEYTVDTEHLGTDVYKGLRCYTDGSKTKTGAGAGICMAVGNHILRTRAHGLSKHATVTQTELEAIKIACTHITALLEENEELRKDHKKVVILTDSRAAMGALKQIDTKSKTVKDTKLALNKLAANIDVEIKWIMSHKGITGNEIADRAAKAGSKLRPTIATTKSKSAIKQQVNEVIYAEWDDRWQNQPSCRQTKIFFPSIDRGKSKKIIGMSKHDLSILVRHITGHVHLDRHRKIIGDYGQNDGITQDFRV